MKILKALAVAFLFILEFLNPTLLSFSFSWGEENPLSVGKKLYSSFCTQCHGKNGKGNGVNAEYLNPDPRDHTDSIKGYMTNLSDKNIIKAITEGGRGVDISPGMPAFGWTFSEYEIGALAAYVRTLHPNNAGPIDFSTLNREKPRMEFKEVEIRAPEGEMTLKIGKGHYKRAGCDGCHKIKEYGGESGPALDGISSRKNAQEIFKVIKDPLGVKTDSRMPNVCPSDEAAVYITLYLLSL